MGIKNIELIDNTNVAIAQNSDALDVEKIDRVDLVLAISDITPADDTFNTGTMDVKTVTFTGVTQEQENTITFPAKASATDGDYVVIPDAAGTNWAIALDTTGGAAQTPTGAAWTAVAAGNKDYVDISGATTAADVAALVETAFDALTGASSSFATDDTAADGTMLFTSQIHGPAAVPTGYSYDDMGSGSITAAQTNAYAGPADGDYLAFYDQSGGAWAAAVDLQGTQSQTPTGAVWTGIAAANKVEVDISGVSSAADIAAAFETAIDGLTGLTSVITTDDTAADGTMLFTQIVPGTVTAFDPNTYNDGGAGSISVANTTPGVAGDVDIDNDSIALAGVVFPTGTKITQLTSTGTLPGGLSTSTVYYIIDNGDDTYSFAVSQANALAGTKINLTNYGTTTAVHTIDFDATIVGTAKIQKNIEPSTATANWVDLDNTEVFNANNSQNIAAGNLQWVLKDLCCSQIRAVLAVTAGAVTVDLRAYARYAR